MTREEEIREAAEDYSAYIDGTDEERYNSTELEAFKAGAEWADKHLAGTTDKRSMASSNEVWLARSYYESCQSKKESQIKKAHG